MESTENIQMESQPVDETAPNSPTPPELTITDLVNIRSIVTNI